MTPPVDKTIVFLHIPKTAGTTGWQKLYYARLNVTRKRPSANVLDPQTRQSIIQANQYDIALYDYAQTLFQQQTERYGPAFVADVQAFQRRNRQLSPLFYLAWHAERQPKLAYRRGKLHLRDWVGRVRSRLNR